ncbi:MAG TPA: NAD(P)H-binding protein [Gemmatimonadales bacterium]|jgi:uncharacterized protein YbjT (DUF2867 family)|nr:NAD(P)H-binding protein [Gemmatimonadales bacterium]
MITIMGATGNTGRPAVEQLLTLGEKVRVLGRSADRLKPLVMAGAEARVGDPTDPVFLSQTMQGTEAVSVMIPPDYQAPDVLAYYDRVGIAAEQAIRRNRIRRVTFLSSVGAELPSGTGPIAGLGRQERRLSALGADVLFLRPSYFYENFYSAIPMIRHLGLIGGAIAPDAPFPMTATRDVGMAIADALHRRDWSGVSVRELPGPRDYTMAETTAMIGRAIGKPDLKYVQFPDADFVKGLLQAGFSENAAGLFVEMAHALSDKTIHLLEPRSAKNTMPTSFESWVEGFGKVYEAGEGH